jgi:hypothetical protein
LLGPAAISPGERLVAEGTVEGVNGHYRLTLNVRQEKAAVGVTRVFESDSCESLAGAAAVTLALLARGEREVLSSSAPGAESTPPAPSSMPSSSASEVPAPSPSAPPTATPNPPTPAEKRPAAGEEPRRLTEPEDGSPERPLAFALELPLLVVDAGILPSWAYGVGGGAGFRAGRVQAMIAGVFWLPQSSMGASSFSGNYMRRSGKLSGCYSWRFGHVELGPCVTIALEDVTAQGSGPDVVGGPGHTTWVTAGLAGRAAWDLRRWATLFIRPSVTLSTSRPTFAIESVGSLYQVPPVAAGLELGCEWIF